MPIIDAHAHVSVPSEIWAYKAGLAIASRRAMAIAVLN